MMSIFTKHRFLLASLLVTLFMSTDARKIRSSGLTSRHRHHHLHHIKSNALSPDLYKLRGGEVDIDSTTTAAATHYQRTISTLHSTSFLHEHHTMTPLLSCIKQRSACDDVVVHLLSYILIQQPRRTFQNRS